jgi:hypothetical protein
VRPFDALPAELTETPALAMHRAHAEHTGSPLAVWLGILLDGIPESVVIGAGLYVVLVAHPAVDMLRLVQVIPYTLIAGLFPPTARSNNGR